MRTLIDGSLLASDEAALACLRAAGLNPHACERTAQPFLDTAGQPRIGRARYVSYTFWVTGFGELLDRRAFPFEPVDGPSGPLPDGVAEVGVDVLTVRHGAVWDECFVQIRSALHRPTSNDPADPAMCWDFRYNRAVQKPEPQGISWTEATDAALADIEGTQLTTA